MILKMRARNHFIWLAIHCQIVIDLRLSLIALINKCLGRLLRKFIDNYKNPVFKNSIYNVSENEFVLEEGNLALDKILDSKV